MYWMDCIIFTISLFWLYCTVHSHQIASQCSVGLTWAAGGGSLDGEVSATFCNRQSNSAPTAVVRRANRCSEHYIFIALLYSMVQCTRSIALQFKIIYFITTHCSGWSHSAELFTIEWPQLNILLRLMPAHASYCHQSSIARPAYTHACFIHSTLRTNLLKRKCKSFLMQHNIEHHTHASYAQQSLN